MTIWSDSLDAIYASPIAVDAQIEPGTGGTAANIRVIDKTDGIEISDGGQASTMTIKPAVNVRMTELAVNSLGKDDVDGGVIVLNSKRWTVEAHLMRPSPDGEAAGEIILLLTDEAG